MKKEMNLASRIWEIVYPVLMYYATLSIASYIAQMIFGTGDEQYMLCKTIGSIVAIPVVFTDYKNDLMLTGRYGQKGDRVKTGWIIEMLAITFCLSVALNNILCMSPLVQMSEEFQDASNAFYGSTIGIELVGSALVTPLLEELLHRGVVYGRLRRRMGMWSSVILSALIFAILHFNIVQFIYAFLLGIVFALFVEKTGKLYPAVLAHILANGVAVIRTETGFLQNTVDGSAVAWIYSIVHLVVGILGVILMWKNYREEK